jgi:hypothetical protein
VILPSTPAAAHHARFASGLLLPQQGSRPSFALVLRYACKDAELMNCCHVSIDAGFINCFEVASNRDTRLVSSSLTARHHPAREDSNKGQPGRRALHRTPECEGPRSRNGVGDSACLACRVAGERAALLGRWAALGLVICETVEMIEVEARPDIDGVVRE